MVEKNYNKLVRDKIPEVIEKNGEKPIYSFLDKENYLKELNRKLLEEIKEYIKEDNIEELADILEVFLTILESKGITWEDLEKVRIKKSNSSGGLKKSYKRNMKITNIYIS